MRSLPLCLASIVALGLAGCESSTRLGNVFGSQRVAARPYQSSPEPIIAAPTPQVDSAPLSAPTGVGTAVPQSADPNVVAGQPDPNALPPVTPPPAPKPVTPRVAAVQPAPESSGPTRTGVTGNWSIAESAGGKCRATLSSAPALDLYKASTSGCATKEIQRVTAWELRGNDIYLYEAGGAVAARLQSAGGNTFNGATAKSGAPITLSK